MNAMPPLPTATPGFPTTSSRFVVRAHRLAADSIATIDNEIAALPHFSVDPTFLPKLSATLTSLYGTLNTWSQTIRPQAVSALQTTAGLYQPLATKWAGVDVNDEAARTSFVAEMKQAVTAANAPMDAVHTAVSGFSSAIDLAVSMLATERATVLAKISAAQQQYAAEERRVAAMQAEIAYFRSHPWVIIAEGIALPALIYQLYQLIHTEESGERAAAEAGQTREELDQLYAANAPLQMLVVGLQCLGGGLLNVQSGLSQCCNELNDILYDSPILFKIAMSTVLDNVQQAGTIANEILQPNPGSAA